jgi:tetratricopeptide (TPR) repeat protein
MSTDRDLQDLLADADAAIITAAFQTGDFGPARASLEEAREQAEGAGDARGLGQALNGLGMVAHHENLGALIGGSAPADPDVAAEEQLFRSALARGQEGGHAAVTAQALFGLGLVFQVLRRDWMTAMPFYWQALGLVSEPGSAAGPYLRSEVHRHLGFYYAYEDVQPGEAVRHLQISLDLREDLGEPRYLPSALVALGEAELLAGHPDQAADLLSRAVEVARAEKLLPHRIEDAERALRDARAAGGARS